MKMSHFTIQWGLGPLSPHSTPMAGRIWPAGPRFPSYKI